MWSNGDDPSVQSQTQGQIMGKELTS